MIFISAGHHAYSKGASFDGWYEYDETKLWASLIAYYIGDGAIVVPSGLLKDKVNFINSFAEIEMAIEIHFNSDPQRAGKGCETLYCPGSEQGKKLANEVHDSFSNIFSHDRGIKEGWYQMNPAKGPDYFLKRTKCPAIIIEPEFIHNKEEIIQNRDAACIAIATGINSYRGN